MPDLDKPYDPKTTEDRIYKAWDTAGYFNPDKLPGKRTKPFTIVVPPPNVTGSLHMGHALNVTIQDVLVRKRRMEGFKTLWLPGIDHAGIATQNVVEKDLKKQGVSRHDLGREKFIEKIWEWKEKYGGIILGQFRKMGASMDWSRTRFTMDEEYQKAVKEVFLHYHKKGWLYKAERVINWCTRCQTSLSDLELERVEQKGKLYFITYPVVNIGVITVATTRPETMLGDTAVAVHPSDKRYAGLIGKKVMLPLVNREIPIIADKDIDMAFGTGAVKVTPAHDILDGQIGERHKLPVIKVIGTLGKMTEHAGKYAGLKIAEAREKVIADLTSAGALEKTEDHVNNLSVCYRCSTTIEPLPSLQWFLKMQELAKLAITAVETGKVRFHPASWEEMYLRWLREVRDWNVSRQIWWGHTIPIEGETDVLDTWFSSALWPFATLGWPEKTPDLKNFYPTQVLSTARDIVNLWVARMVFSGMEFMGEAPFTDVIIHATVLAKSGQRMSKSLGTGIDPMTLVDLHGADATRFGLIWQAMGTQDIKWDEAAVTAGKKFSNKLWNIARYTLQKVESSKWKIEGEASSNPEDKAILQKFTAVKKLAEECIESYQFGQALHAIYDFVWHDVADTYLEATKGRDDDESRQTLMALLIGTLKLLHPFMPFITEEIWAKLPEWKGKQMLIVENWE